MLFNDQKWLRDYATFGPSARAAIGILVSRGDWAWWQLRSHDDLVRSLRAAVPRSGVAVWGGDNAVLSTEDWVDATLAIEAARAFEVVLASRPDLRLKIGRVVWEWDGVKETAGDLLSYLTQTVPERGAFFEWPEDRRPRRPTFERQDGAMIVATLSGGPGRPRQSDPALVTSFNQASDVSLAQWRQDTGTSDILIAPSVELLRTGSFTSQVVIVTTDDRQSLLQSLDELRISTGAQCIIRVARGSSDNWMRAFGNLWAQRRLRVDEAVAVVNQETGLQGEVVASNQTFLLASHRFVSLRTVDEETYSPAPDHYARRASPTSEDGVELLNPFSSRPPPTARVLEVGVSSGGRRITTLPKNGKITFAVSIQPKTPLGRNDVLFPDHIVDWKSDFRTLQVHLLGLGGEPMSRPLVLPRTGPSDVSQFPYEISGPRRIDLRFMVCDGSQILQTARFKGKPGGSCTFFIETDISSLEDTPRSFDFSLLVNDSLGGKPSITSIAGDVVHIDTFEGSEVEALRIEATDTLRAVASNSKMAFDVALKELADVGSRTLGALRKWVKNWPETFERVQLMTKVNAIFPFEFLYDGPLPLDADAPLCPQSASCLAAPRGTACCSRRATREVFCPLGFLGLNVIIERHAWDADQTHPFWLRRSEDFSKRKTLPGLQDIIFAASDKADLFKQEVGVPAEHKLAKLADLTQAFGSRALSWADWRAAVRSEDHPPAMAVLVPHVEGKKLYIGKADAIYLSTLEMGTASVAIVVGCNTAAGEVAALSLPSSILREGSVRVVIAALTEILGRHSNTAAMTLGTKIRDASQAAEVTTIGEFVTALRRDFLSKGIVMGLVLVAVGDADVVLGGGVT